MYISSKFTATSTVPLSLVRVVFAHSGDPLFCDQCCNLLCVQPCFVSVCQCTHGAVCWGTTHCDRAAVLQRNDKSVALPMVQLVKQFAPDEASTSSFTWPEQPPYQKVSLQSTSRIPFLCSIQICPFVSTLVQITAGVRHVSGRVGCIQQC